MARKTNPELQEKIAAVKREQILEAARLVFAEKGFHRATIKAIAARAGVADGTVYNFFENKNALILALMASFTNMDGREGDFNKLGAGGADSDLAAVLAAYLHQRLGQLSEVNISLFQAVLPELLANPDLRTRFREDITAPTFALADQLLLPLLQQEGGLEHDQAALLLRLTAALAVGLIVLRIIGEPELERQWPAVPAAVAALLRLTPTTTAATPAITEQEPPS
jgi:AcrR family transcriptional regulator